MKTPSTTGLHRVPRRRGNPIQYAPVGCMHYILRISIDHIPPVSSTIRVFTPPTPMLLRQPFSRLTMAALSYNEKRALCTICNTGLLQARRLTISSQQQPPNPTSVRAQKNSGLGIIDGMARKIRKVAPVSTETYHAYTRGKELYLECARQAAYVGEGRMEERAQFWYLGMHAMPA